MGGKDVPLRYILPTGARPVSDAVSALGAYTFADAARYVRAPVATVRAWFLGTKTGWGTFQPVLHLDDSGHRMLSFRNLVELYVLYSIRKRHRVTLFRVGIAIDILSRSWKSEHPLVEQDILTDGYELVAENRKTPWREACRLFPFPSAEVESAEPRTIEINPSIQFGRPCLAGTGIPAKLLYHRHREVTRLMFSLPTMKCRSNGCKKRSTSSRIFVVSVPSHRTDDFTFLVDRCLRRYTIPEASSALGYAVELHSDHSSPNERRRRGGVLDMPGAPGLRYRPSGARRAGGAPDWRRR